MNSRRILALSLAAGGMLVSLSAIPARATLLEFDVSLTSKDNFSASGGAPIVTLDGSFTPFDFDISQQVSDPGTAGALQIFTTPGTFTENYSILYALNPTTLTTPLDASLLAFDTHGATTAATTAYGEQYFDQPTGGSGVGQSDSNDYSTQSNSDCQKISSTDERCSGFSYQVFFQAVTAGPSSLAGVQGETYADFLANFSATSPTIPFEIFVEDYSYDYNPVDYAGLVYSEYSGAEYFGTAAMTAALVDLPEPGSLALLLSGLGAAAALRSRRRRGR